MKRTLLAGLLGFGMALSLFVASALAGEIQDFAPAHDTPCVAGEAHIGEEESATISPSYILGWKWWRTTR